MSRLSVLPRMTVVPRLTLGDRSRMTVAAALATDLLLSKPPPNYTVKSPLNTSQSKQQFSFSKASRFSDPKT